MVDVKQFAKNHIAPRWTSFSADFYFLYVELQIDLQSIKRNPSTLHILMFP